MFVKVLKCILLKKRCYVRTVFSSFFYYNVKIIDHYIELLKPKNQNIICLRSNNNANENIKEIS